MVVEIHAFESTDIFSIHNLGYVYMKEQQELRELAVILFL